MFKIVFLITIFAVLASAHHYYQHAEDKESHWIPSSSNLKSHEHQIHIEDDVNDYKPSDPPTPYGITPIVSPNLEKEFPAPAPVPIAAPVLDPVVEVLTKPKYIKPELPSNLKKSEKSIKDTNYQWEHSLDHYGHGEIERPIHLECQVKIEAGFKPEYVPRLYEQVGAIGNPETQPEKLPIKLESTSTLQNSDAQEAAQPQEVKLTR